ncbi:MAG: site-2 protease family protein [Peptococcaceae bacterium]|jgi:regulator of sigma E protease|nr:site-2 protease family protein [Peptococcaceae bacterium]
MTLVWFLLIISVLVFVHEFGHFIVAKRGGIKVIEFAFGFGPRLIKVQRGETIYSVRALPLGGFCRFLSEHELKADLEEGAISQEDYEEQLPRSFERKSYGRRMGVITGGSVFNFVFGAILFVLLFAVWGVQEGTGSNLVAGVVPDYPASQAGIEAGDRIVMINGEDTPDWSALTALITAAQDHEALIRVEKPDGSVRDISVTPKYDSVAKRAIIGINNEYVNKKVSPLEAMRLGAIQTVEFTKFLVATLVGMLTGQQSTEQLGGPIKLAEQIGQGAQQGASTLWGLTAVLSIQFGVINMFPIPAVDGGQVVVMTYERIRGKELKPEMKSLIQMVGLALLTLLMVGLLFKDIMGIFQA